ncbi:MAG: methylmalonyl Co-A mutase-associated GTPase MeaB [Leptospirales bacterium]|nr:methylmalonyl Co-A mutase-associated GTPase MeaB [Leptospirales bacterium]
MKIDVPAILAGDRRMLARAITMIESTRPEDETEADALLQQVLPHTGRSVRIAVSGSPGAGKSTFIETFGTKLIQGGRKVAVLAVDPTSSITGGSILGDKTRMSALAAHSSAFVRPSPSGGSLGGVNRRTREVIWLVEAAGFDRIILETVGVGQSEIDAAGMTDFYLLVQLPNAGDELQGIKKGILEIADCIFVNKSDLDRASALRSRSELESALHYQRPRTSGWHIEVIAGSALSGEGLDDLLAVISKFCEHQGYSNQDEKPPTGSLLHLRRCAQLTDWMHDRIKDGLLRSFYANPNVQSMLPELENQISNGSLLVTDAFKKLFDAFLQGARS